MMQKQTMEPKVVHIFDKALGSRPVARMPGVVQWTQSRESPLTDPEPSTSTRCDKQLG